MGDFKTRPDFVKNLVIDDKNHIQHPVKMVISKCGPRLFVLDGQLNTFTTGNGTIQVFKLNPS